MQGGKVHGGECGGERYVRSQREGDSFIGSLFRGADGRRALATGALIGAGVMLLAANRNRLKPALMATMKEYYRFSDWLTTSFAQVKEDLSDVAAEARHDREREVASHLEALEKERELIERITKLAGKQPNGRS